MTRAAIYCRLSEEDRNKKNGFTESESIQNQKSMLEEYCKKQNWEIAGIFCDEDMSGADRDRPEFHRMLAYCRTGQADVVLCKTQSRFSRDMEVVEHYIHNRFKEWGVRFVSVLDHADTEDVFNKKSRQINGLVNEWYLEDLSENIKKTLRHKKEKGIYTGSFAPYGYRLDPDKKGKLFIDETAAVNIQRIYQMYLGGFGYIKIAKTLNAERIPCPSVYKAICGSKFRTNGGRGTSDMWTESTVRQILTNPVYCGTLVQRKTEKISYKHKRRKRMGKEEQLIKEFAHDPVIEKEIWNEVNDRIGKQQRTQKEGTRHIFAGKIYCAACGSVMWKMSYRLKDGRYAYLKCKSTKCADGVCDNKASIRYDVLCDLVRQEIHKILRMYYRPEAVNRKAIMPQRIKLNENEEMFTKNLILKQKSNMKQLYKDKLDGIIDNELFYELYREAKDAISKLESGLSAVKAETDTEQLEKVQLYMEDFWNKIEPDAYTVACFLSRVEVGREQNGVRPITLFWNI